MAETKPLTGWELEERGLMVFSCDSCRALFPRRCENHRVIPGDAEKTPDKDHRKLELLLVHRPPKLPVLAYGRPMLEYTAPYEGLEADIGGVLKALAGKGVP